jgi:hypothetical protein
VIPQKDKKILFAMLGLQKKFIVEQLTNDVKARHK